jgi:hypothetical protein
VQFRALRRSAQRGRRGRGIARAWNGIAASAGIASHTLLAATRSVPPIALAGGDQGSSASGLTSTKRSPAK